MNGWSHGMGTRAMPPRLSLSPYTFGQGDADCSQPPSILFSSSPPDSFSSISTTFQRGHECTLMPFFSLGGQLFLLDSQLAAIKLLATFLNIHRLLSLLPSFGDQRACGRHMMSTNWEPAPASTPASLSFGENAAREGSTPHGDRTTVDPWLRRPRLAC